MLAPGDYVVKSTDAKIVKTKDKKGDRLELKFQDVKGGGTITHWINLNLPGKHEATRIGREQFKSFLYYGGHPTPNKPGDVSTYKGLVVGIRVVATEYNGKESAEVQYVCDPAKVDPTSFTAKPEPTKVAETPFLAAVGGDSIPF